MSDSNAPAGWYPDSTSNGRLRYWDGSVWTNQFDPGPHPDQRISDPDSRTGASGSSRRPRVPVPVIAVAGVALLGAVGGGIVLAWWDGGQGMCPVSDAELSQALGFPVEYNNYVAESAYSGGSDCLFYASDHDDPVTWLRISWGDREHDYSDNTGYTDLGGVDLGGANGSLARFTEDGSSHSLVSVRLHDEHVVVNADTRALADPGITADPADADQVAVTVGALLTHLQLGDQG